MEIDHAARKARARAYLAERVVTREPYIGADGKLRQRWVETTHYTYTEEEKHDASTERARRGAAGRGGREAAPERQGGA